MTTLRPSRVDLHCHTARSDGVLEPRALYEQMRAAGMALVAITDHDTLGGVRELYAAGLGRAPSAAGPRLVVGVEINTVADGAVPPTGPGRWGEELHILGFGMDPADAALEGTLEAQRRGRRDRLEETLSRLASNGTDVREHLPVVAGGIESRGRPHVARALMAAGYARSVPDAFERYLGRGRPAYVPRVGIGPRAAIEAVSAAGGVAVLAHSPDAPRERALVLRLMDWGLGGLEVHYRSFDEKTVAALLALADELGLLPTGGSDYHGDEMDYRTALATVFVPDSVGERLLAALDGRPGNVAPASRSGRPPASAT